MLRTCEPGLALEPSLPRGYRPRLRRVLPHAARVLGAVAAS